MKIVPITSHNYSDVVTIYLQGIATGLATFETSASSWEDWDASHFDFGRITAMDNNSMAGWAALSKVSSRCVYQGVAEVSVYVANQSRGKGVGKFLLRHLIRISEENNIWTLQSGIFRDNKSSIALHLSCGFRILGYREKIGQLHGQWKDNLQLERRSSIVGL